jgi:DNA-binding PadR family transcriptional regulator
MGQELPVTSYALLGLLTFGDELTGYELKQRADRTLRFYWVSPAMSQVYSELRRLSSAGLVEPTEPAERTTRYRITTEGRRALRRWLGEGQAGFPVLKHPVALRLLMGRVADDETMVRMLEEYVADLSRQRSDLADVRVSLQGADAPGEAFRNPALVADWGLAYYDNEAEIARSTLERLREGT